jgi:hypothetical protein
MNVDEKRIEELAEKMVAEGDPAATDLPSARMAARRRLEDSDQRTLDPEAGRTSDSEAIHRTSREATETGGPDAPAEG